MAALAQSIRIESINRLALKTCRNKIGKVVIQLNLRIANLKSIHMLAIHRRCVVFDPAVRFVERGAEVEYPAAPGGTGVVDDLYLHILESDVHQTRDGVPVLSHDASLERTAGSPQRIDALAGEWVGAEEVQLR